MSDRHTCCAVWLRYRDGNIHHGCPHCWRISSTHTEGDADLARRQCDSSIRGHARACPIPVRWAPVTSTPVRAARPVRQPAIRPVRRRAIGRR